MAPAPVVAATRFRFGGRFHGTGPGPGREVTMKVLAVDDNRDNVELLCQILEERYEMLRAYSGPDAIRIAEAERPGLIILDVKMPGMDGYAVLEELQGRPSTAEIPVIFLTARYKDTDRVIKGLELGAFDYITKPVDEELLLARVGVAARVRRAEDEIRRQREDLARANAKLAEADRLKSIFLASMSHELRTPLNSIIGFAGIILMGMAGEINPEVRKQLTMVKRSAGHLLNLINDLLDLSRIEAGKARITRASFDLAEMLGEVAASFQPQAEEGGIRLSVDLPGRIVMTSDLRRVKQIVMNFVANAIKFTEAGEVRIRAENTGDRRVRIHVADTGIGIPEADIGRLFEPFLSLSEGGHKKRKGAGLGLYLSRKLAHRLRGEISVFSKPGAGSTFTLTLPVFLEEER